MKNSSHQTAKNSGFIRLIILILIVLITLSYFGYDIKKIIYAPVVVKIFTLIWDLVLFTLKLLITLIKESWGTIVKIPDFITHFAQSLKSN